MTSYSFATRDTFSGEAKHRRESASYPPSNKRPEYEVGNLEVGFKWRVAAENKMRSTEAPRSVTIMTVEREPSTTEPWQPSRVARD